MSLNPSDIPLLLSSSETLSVNGDEICSGMLLKKSSKFSLVFILLVSGKIQDKSNDTKVKAPKIMNGKDLLNALRFVAINGAAVDPTRPAN